RSAHEELLRLVVTENPMVFYHWDEDACALPRVVDRPTRCFGCGHKGRLREVRTAFSVRWNASCDRCKVVFADTPAGSDLTDVGFTIDENRRIVHEMPQLPAQALAATVRTSMFENWNAWRLEELPLLADWRSGLSWLWFYSLSNDGLHAYCRLFDNRVLERME